MGPEDEESMGPEEEESEFVFLKFVNLSFVFVNLRHSKFKIMNLSLRFMNLRTIKWLLDS